MESLIHKANQFSSSAKFAWRHKVAVDLRATQIRVVRRRRPMDDRTYDPNSQKLDDTKSGYISGTEMAT